MSLQNYDMFIIVLFILFYFFIFYRFQCARDILNSEAQQYVNNCAISSQGDELLVKYGDKTHSLEPPVSFIPTIIINQPYSKKSQQEIRNNFKLAICDNLPNEGKPSTCA